MADTSKGFERARKEAKRWLKALRGGDSEALERFQKALPRHTDNPGLREVQQAKAALKTLPAADLRVALEFRRRALGGELA